MKGTWSVNNSGSGFSNANVGPGAQYNNNVAGSQYNYYGTPYTGTDQENDRLKREKQECLQSLSFSNIDARLQDIVLAHPNTGDWIFETIEFRQWRGRTDLSKHNGVLWIKGHPGTGKSTLMKHIWGHCQRELQDRTIATYFFHARGESLEKTPLGMLRSLVCQLVDKEEPTYQRFLLHFREKNRLFQKWEWRESELKGFLLSKMEIRERPPLVILIDALDECSDSQVRDVVKFLEQLSITCLRHEVNVCICLSSRHYPHITMAKYQELVVETMNGHDTDIATYVHGNLTRPDPKLEKRVLKKASGIFMWAVLVVAMLNKAFEEGKVEAMKQKFREVPSNLDELFSTILSNENSDTHETILMLQWVLFAVQPLTPEELYYATLAGTRVKDLRLLDRSRVTADDIRRRIMHSSRGLIEVPQANRTVYVQFIHESVEDFLLRNKRLQSLDPALESNPIGQSHDRLRTCCVSFIGITASILDDVSIVAMLRQQPVESNLKYPFVWYAFAYWLHHAEAAEAGNVSQTEFLRGIKEDLGAERLLLAQTLLFDKVLLPGENYADLLYISLALVASNIARILIEHGADISPQGWNYGHALYAAVFNDSTKMLRLLLEYGADPNFRHGECAVLWHAVSRGYKEAVSALLEHGADINASNRDSETALYQAVSRYVQSSPTEEQADLIALLLGQGANVNAKERHHRTALHLAIIGAQSRIVALLLKYDADVNYCINKYENPLMLAVAIGNEEIVALLLEHGADVNAELGKHGNALRRAISKMASKEIVTLLLEHGAKVDVKVGLGATPLQVAIATRQKDIEMLLREHGATM